MGETRGPEVVVYGSDNDEPILLTAEDVRVLGVLVEKQITTPDYYPLTLNALVNGCNQTSSRDPIVRYDESTVIRALDRLRDQKLAFVYSGADSRTLKYGHKLRERLELGPAETAALCVLLLRGPQTTGEIRSRSGRLHEFESIAEVEAAVETLCTRQPQALGKKLPRQTGLKESRFAHLLAGEPVIPEAGGALPTAADPDRSAPLDSARVQQLEAEVIQLRTEISDLRLQFAEFKRQFE